MDEHDATTPAPPPFDFIAATETPPLAEELTPPAPRRPPVWPAIVVPLGAIVTTLVVSTVIMLAAMLSHGTELFRSPAKLREWLAEFIATMPGFLISFVPSQTIFLLAAIIAVMLAREPLRRRLGFTRGASPVWVWLLAAAATPFAGAIGGMLAWDVEEGSLDSITMLHEMFSRVSGGWAVGLVVLISVLPAVCEETLFRGYMMRRLAERWHPALAIGLSALVFGMAHIDPRHVLAVMPLGLWMGFVAYRTGSILPAILCHATNNTLGATAGVLGADPTESPEGGEWVVMAVFGLVFVASVWSMRRFSRAATLAA